VGQSRVRATEDVLKAQARASESTPTTEQLARNQRLKQSIGFVSDMEIRKGREQGELVEIPGAFCLYHLRLDGQITIYAIAVAPDQQRQGLGRRMIAELTLRHPEATSIFAKCLVVAPANHFYAGTGFWPEDQSLSRGGRLLHHWRLRGMLTGLAAGTGLEKRLDDCVAKLRQAE